MDDKTKTLFTINMFHGVEQLHNLNFKLCLSQTETTYCVLSYMHRTSDFHNFKKCAETLKLLTWHHL